MKIFISICAIIILEVARTSRLCNPHEQDIDLEACAEDILKKLVSPLAPSSPEWAYLDKVSAKGVYRIAKEFEFDSKKLLLVPDISSKPFHYFVFYNAAQYQEMLRPKP